MSCSFRMLKGGENHGIFARFAWPAAGARPGGCLGVAI